MSHNDSYRFATSEARQARFSLSESIEPTSGSDNLENVLVPQPLQDLADAWIEKPEIDAVLLFGSRITGYARPNSDWDVVVLHDNFDGTLDVTDLPNHISIDLSYLSSERFQNQARKTGNFAHELWQSNQVLAGKLPAVPDASVSIDQDRLAGHVAYSLKNLCYAINHITDGWRRHNRPASVNDFYFPEIFRYSVFAADRTIKAVCVATGCPLKFVHDIPRLASLVSPQLRQQVIAFEGNIPRLHKTSMERLLYLRPKPDGSGVEYEQVEPTSKSANRIEMCIAIFEAILIDWLEMLSEDYLQVLQSHIEADFTFKNLYEIADYEHSHPTLQNLATRLFSVRQSMIDFVKNEVN